MNFETLDERLSDEKQTGIEQPDILKSLDKVGFETKTLKVFIGAISEKLRKNNLPLTDDGSCRIDIQGYGLEPNIGSYAIDHDQGEIDKLKRIWKHEMENKLHKKLTDEEFMAERERSLGNRMEMYTTVLLNQHLPNYYVCRTSEADDYGVDRRTAKADIVICKKINGTIIGVIDLVTEDDRLGDNIKRKKDKVTQDRQNKGILKYGFKTNGDGSVALEAGKEIPVFYLDLFSSDLEGALKELTDAGKIGEKGDTILKQFLLSLYQQIDSLQAELKFRKEAGYRNPGLTDQINNFRAGLELVAKQDRLKAWQQEQNRKRNEETANNKKTRRERLARSKNFVPAKTAGTSSVHRKDVATG